MREKIAALVPDPVEEWDRRGYPLIHWRSTVTDVKQDELSLEHEVLLQPIDSDSLGRLITALHVNEASEGRHSWPSWPSTLPEWGLRRFDRSPGPQSVDVYFDLPGEQLTRGGYTLRVRRTDSPFMTWGASSVDGVRAINAELPAERIPGASGIVARLELNWLARVSHFETPIVSPQPNQADPLNILGGLVGAPLNTLRPLSVHSTVRSKFAFYEQREGGTVEDRLIVNIDFIFATSRGSGESVSWVDVDVSSVRRIDEAEMLILDTFAEYLRTTFRLRDRSITKSARFMETLAGTWGQG